jgi:flagellar biosynthesis protein FliR
VTIDANPVWLLALLLAFVRAGAWLVVVPPFSNRQTIPPMAVVGVAGGLALLAAPHLAQTPIPTSTPGLIASVLTQAATGVALGLSIRVLLAAATSAGSMIDLFGGLNLPPSIDPLSENQTPLFGQLFEQVAMTLLFVTNGEMLLVHGFEASFNAPGLTLSSGSTLSSVLISDLATFFTATLEIAAPIIIVLFTAQVGLALLAKAAPQVNVWVLGFPIQAMLSLIFVAIAIKVLPTSVANLLDRALQDMGQVLGGH